VTAQAAATLHLMTRGRAILGIGPGERVGNEPYGVDWSKPVARFEEALATIRALWDSKGELVNRDSPFYPLRDAMFDLPPYKGKWPEIWVAAHGPRMLRATGRYGDAWFPGFAHRPEDYAKRLEIIRSAASDAGRDPMAITPAFWIPVVAGSSRAAVDDALGTTVVKAWALNAPAEFYTHHGAAHPMGAGFAGMQDHVSFTMDEKTIREKSAEVPLSVVKGMVPMVAHSAVPPHPITPCQQLVARSMSASHSATTMLSLSIVATGMPHLSIARVPVTHRTVAPKAVQ
jgi:phthiodiolone/phenolphthiodiolone dimycocerosates ketoreductase